MILIICKNKKDMVEKIKKSTGEKVSRHIETRDEIRLDLECGVKYKIISMMMGVENSRGNSYELVLCDFNIFLESRVEEILHCCSRGELYYIDFETTPVPMCKNIKEKWELYLVNSQKEAYLKENILGRLNTLVGRTKILFHNFMRNEHTEYRPLLTKVVSHKNERVITVMDLEVPEIHLKSKSIEIIDS